MDLPNLLATISIGVEIIAIVVAIVIAFISNNGGKTPRNPNKSA